VVARPRITLDDFAEWIKGVWLDIGFVLAFLSLAWGAWLAQELAWAWLAGTVEGLLERWST
jgi:hypothetical protein